MKDAVAAASLKTAQYARIHNPTEVAAAMSTLSLSYPIVIKTPQGMSSTDVYICETEQDACKRTAQIVGHVGPDSRPVHCALLEEYIPGDEFACNLIASPHLDGLGICVTDVWKYSKTSANETARYDSAQMMNPEDPALEFVLLYAAASARAVGVVYGAAHVELKALYDQVLLAYALSLPGCLALVGLVSPSAGDSVDVSLAQSLPRYIDGRTLYLRECGGCAEAATLG